MYLGNFTGLGDAKSFLRRFHLLATKENWSNEEKRVRLAFALTDSAGTWYTSLPDDKIDSFAALENAFIAHYINNRPSIVIESDLLSCKWSPSEKLEDYYTRIIALGAKLGRKPDHLATNFLNGLPESYKDYLLTTDTHTIDNYLDKARLYQARHPNKLVQFEGQSTFPIHGQNAVTQNDLQALINTFKDGFEQLSLNRGRDSRSDSRSKSPNYRRTYSPGYRRSSSPYKHRSKSPSYRNQGSNYRRSESPEYRRPRPRFLPNTYPRPNVRPSYDSNRGRPNTRVNLPFRSSVRPNYDNNSITCYLCKNVGHFAKDCNYNRKNY